MSNQHWDKCLGNVMKYADSLLQSVIDGTLNKSAVPGLITSYLHQPAFYPEWKNTLYQHAMEIFE